MLTSNNQYLRPEYLSPLPTTLDAKKSPLALLAQTCSNIGADNPSHKSLIPPLEKAKDADKGKSEKPFSCYEKSTFKPYEPVKKDDSVDCEKTTPPCKLGSPDSRTSPARGSEGSCGDKRSPSAENNNTNNNTNSSDLGPVKQDPADSAQTPATLSSSSSPASLSGTQCTLRGLGYSANSLGLDLSRNDPKDGLSQLGLGMYKGGLSPLANCTGCGPVGGAGGGLPPVETSMAHTFPSGLSAQSGISSLRPGGYSVGSGLAPYLGYARVKAATGGATALVPLCRDPYCTNCQFGPLSAACPGGCTQCTHDRLASSLGGSTPAVPGLTTPGFVPAFAGSTSPMGSAMSGLNASLYPMLSRPNICSWMVGDTYCGKRFTTSEELLQHLRTHTTISVADTSSIPLFSASVAPGTLGAACPLSYSSAPSLTSAGLRRTYPTSISPVSSLSVASRYHPYKPPLPTLPGNALPPLPHPGLSMYYSPYSLYGQRLGPPVHP